MRACLVKTESPGCWILRAVLEDMGFTVRFRRHPEPSDLLVLPGGLTPLVRRLTWGLDTAVAETPTLAVCGGAVALCMSGVVPVRARWLSLAKAKSYFMDKEPVPARVRFSRGLLCRETVLGWWASPSFRVLGPSGVADTGFYVDEKISRMAGGRVAAVLLDLDARAALLGPHPEYIYSGRRFLRRVVEWLTCP